MKHHIVRCSHPRKHLKRINPTSVIEQRACNHFIGAIPLGVRTDVVMRCATCNVMWSVSTTNDSLVMKELPPGTQLEEVDEVDRVKVVYGES